jgi:hypothetical protein
MLSNKWHFTFDEGTRSIYFSIHLWSYEKEDAMRNFYNRYSQKQIKLMFEMIETAYFLSLIEVKN